MSGQATPPPSGYGAGAEPLLEAVFGDESSRMPARESLRARPGGAESLQAFEAELARAAAALRRGSRAREPLLVARILARTTRQDLSWRGDLALVLRFLGARLRSSAVLRLVAASLVLHLVALPALGYWMWRESRPERRFVLHVELPPESFFPPDDAAEPELSASPARRSEEIENALARSRVWLVQNGPRAPRIEAVPGAAPELVLLSARAHGLRAREWRADLDAAPAEAGGALLLCLWVELQLDRFVWTRALPTDGDGWTDALRRLETQASESGGGARLAARALRRASAYGLLGTGPATGLLGEDPLGTGWCADLEQAGREAGFSGEDALRAWVDSGVE